MKKNKLIVVVTNFGDFYKAELNGKEISKEEVFKIIGIKYQGGFRLEHYLMDFMDKDSDYEVSYYEKDIS